MSDAEFRYYVKYVEDGLAKGQRHFPLLGHITSGVRDRIRKHFESLGYKVSYEKRYPDSCHKRVRGFWVESRQE